MKTEMNSNRASYVELKEVSFSRVVDFHSKNGYAIVSASRGENSDAENKKLDKQLKADISSAGWTFTPIYGGFVETNKETGEKKNVVERSFLIYNSNRKNKDLSFEDLKKFAIEMCGKYNHEAVFIADPSSETASYFDADGDETFKLDKKITVRNALQEFFSTLNRSKRNVDRNKFTFKQVECCVKLPTTVAGKHSAKLLGETYEIEQQDVSNDF